jgi:divalent metal cation (Fe/Co/Zn/Cd) transporter
VNGTHAEALAADGRSEQLNHALRLEYLTVAWNVVEGTVAVTAAVLAGSVALLGFGIDSFVEMASGLVLLWRLRAESRHRDAEAVLRIDRQARKLVAISLMALAAWVAADAIHTLWTGERPSPTLVGIVLTLVSMAVMRWLARAKKSAARALHSHALESDAAQTSICFWLSVIVLVGIGLNRLFGWWWADPVAALGMTVFLVREGRQAWRGEACCG